MGEKATARRGDPLELTGELHAPRIAAARHRPPLVMRAAGPRAGRQAGVGGDAGKLRVVPEHVELPRGRRVGAQHVTLKTHAVHEISNSRLRAGEVGVRLVVRATHDFDAAVADQPPQVRPVLRMDVPVRLEVIDLGQHELVLRFAAGHLQMRMHQRKSVRLTIGRVCGPDAGVAGLGVPPHRVVVEVADHEHRPAGLGDGEREGCGGAARDHPRRAPLAGYRVGDPNGHLRDPLPRLPRLPGGPQAVALNANGLEVLAEGQPHQLQRRV